MVGTHEVAGKDYVNTENSQMASIDAIFTSTYHTKQLCKSMAKFILSYGELQWAICLTRRDEIIYLKITQALVDI